MSIPASKLKKSVLDILKYEGFIADYTVDESGPQGTLSVYLKYDKDVKPIILGLKRISSPGCRSYVKSTEIPQVLGGLGIAILSTSRGVISDREARRLNVGGEVMAYVW